MGDRKVLIHRKEQNTFAERGLLKFLDHPRTGPLSQDAVDMIIAGLSVAMIVLYFLAHLGWDIGLRGS
jgi:hypothetical protein